MRRFLMTLLLLSSLSAASASGAATGHIVKMLPLFLDLKGRDAISPSLFDRDAYQFFLRTHTNDVSVIRFDAVSYTHLDVYKRQKRRHAQGRERRD